MRLDIGCGTPGRSLDPVDHAEPRHGLHLHITAASVFLLLAAADAVAQPHGLPQPSRTAFKCVIAGRVSYSDAPCPDARRVELQPTRGMDKSSGRTQVGADVRNERAREQIAEAVKPVTGMSPAQFEVARRRVSLPASSKSECAKLDSELPALEIAAAAVPRDARADQAGGQLLAARLRHRALGC